MFEKIRDWFGFGGFETAHHGDHGHGHDGAGGHGHTHGVIDPGIAATDRGVWAIKWSFVILAITAALQLAVVYISGSVALLADTIHNIGDATTAIPLWIAFRLARRKPSTTFTYGLGRVEDLAGLLIVFIILFSAIVAGYEAISRLIHPQPVTELGWLAAAGIVGFLGNEIVAVFRIRVGREMNSAALIADGYHARTDGLTSLAVVLGAVGVYFGFPLADPIIGLLITVAILGIVWQSSRAVVTRMLDGVEPGVVAEIRHAAGHVAGVRQIIDVKGRWLGHELHAALTIAVDETLPVTEADQIAARVEAELRSHLPALAAVTICFGVERFASMATIGADATHHHAPAPFNFEGRLAKGVLDIVDTPQGERMRLTLSRQALHLTARVIINRPDSPEVIGLSPSDNPATHMSTIAPAEPHEFDAMLELTAGNQHETLPFRMLEPEGHHH
ncbi:MAG: cation diffusion facilitator family transporter [Beijerinckiaceae bacterium]|nr:cation diffusion facilitator family transporter [Beijerinckiaceae bacterium]